MKREKQKEKKMARKKVIKNIRWSDLADEILMSWGRDFRNKTFIIGDFYEFTELYQSKVESLALYGDIDKFRIKVIEELEDGDYLVDVTNYTDVSIKHLFVE